MGAPKQVNKLSQTFENPAYEGVTRAQTGNARLLHVNEVLPVWKLALEILINNVHNDVLLTK